MYLLEPIIEMVAKMAQAFGIMVDFLIGSGVNASYDKETVERINDIQKWMQIPKTFYSTSLIPTSKILKRNKLLDK
jgi:hypothetical protein